MNSIEYQTTSFNKTIASRGFLPIYYSTTSGLSKDLAHQFQSKAENVGFCSSVLNVGDINPEEFLQYEGTIVMFLSTYGNGDSPQDGERFLNQIENLKNEMILQKLNFIIMALGNSSFQHFCGHGQRMSQALMRNGAIQLVQMKKCDAYIENQSAAKVFHDWSEDILKILTQKYEVRELPLQTLTGGFSVEIKNQEMDWEAELIKNPLNLKKQFSDYLRSNKAEVIHIKQLRNDANQSNRSTLWVRLRKPKTLDLWPCCNVHIYPENLQSNNQIQDFKTISFIPKQPKSKIPFPPMSIYRLKKLVNLRLKPSKKLLKNAILLSNKPTQVKQKFIILIKENKLEQLDCETILKELQPNYQFYADLGINLPRTYTLASWDSKCEYFDLCVSTLEKGLTSMFLKSQPKELRVNSFESSFTIPSKPLIMIANGSGIAPFRSLVQYMSQQPKQSRTPLYLYYGIQNVSADYYFRQDFEKFQKEEIVQIKLAQSRKNPNHKQYVQQLVQQDKQFFREHLFRNDGLIYICGGKEMAKTVKSAIFKAISLQCEIPYKAFIIMNNFKAKKTIIEELFG